MTKKELLKALSGFKDTDPVFVEVHDTTLYEDLYEFTIDDIDMGNGVTEIRLCPTPHNDGHTDLQQLAAWVANWAERKGLLDRQHAERQMLKVVEELGELASAMAKGKNDELVDAIGDTFVTLIILSRQLGYLPEFALETAWNEIKGRTGKTVNGVFIKD
jgi:NTP pyrophosphatase (non-canonical NTP hydrolase)